MATEYLTFKKDFKVRRRILRPPSLPSAIPSHDLIGWLPSPGANFRVTNPPASFRTRPLSWSSQRRLDCKTAHNICCAHMSSIMLPALINTALEYRVRSLAIQRKSGLRLPESFWQALAPSDAALSLPGSNIVVTIESPWPKLPSLAPCCRRLMLFI